MTVIFLFFKPSELLGPFHVRTELWCARTAGVKGEYPLDSKLYRRKMLEVIGLFSRVYCCRVAGFCVMGNHYGGAGTDLGSSEIDLMTK
jgi:hypothetical protein